MSLLAVRIASDADRLALLIRSAGYVDADEVIEFEDWRWEWFATTAGVAVPTSATRCLVVSLFGSPSLTGTQMPVTPPVTGSASLSEPGGRRFFIGDAATTPTGSTSQRKGGT